MKVLGVVLVLAALAVLGVFLWPLLQPSSEREPQHDEPGYARSAEVATGAPAAPRIEAPAAPRIEAPTAAHPGGPDSAASTGPLCDRLFDARSARPLTLPPHRPMRVAGRSSHPTWTWISLWAAWCKPCKEEMPLLAEWARQLRQGGKEVRMLFLSVDDDERELRRFLDGPGREIEGEFAWVADEHVRSGFYSALGVKDPPTLPVQIVLDPEGKLRCLRVGSVARPDLDAVPGALGF